MTRAIAVLLLAASLATSCDSEATSAAVGLRVVACRPHPELGSGALVRIAGVDEPLVLTAAHVVAGAEDITVTHGDTTRTGTIVAFDPEMDLAYLAIDDGDGSPAWTIDSAAVTSGDTGVALVVRDGVPVVVPVTIERRVTIRTEDIYVEGETRRPGFELTADIDEGDSGGAVVVDGTVVGVVWARSRRAGDRAYAIDPVRAGDRVHAQLRTGDLGDIDLARCP